MFYNEKKIREAVLDARNQPRIPGTGKKGSAIGDPTASAAIKNISPLRRATINGEALEWPEAWLRVIDETYVRCSHDQMIVARDRYAGVDYRQTCAKLSISDATRRRLLDSVRRFASMCAAQLGLIKVC